jgi:hypothetical protein
MRFPGLQREDRVPNAKTVWLFREQLKGLNLVDVLFAGFHQQLAAQVYVARALVMSKPIVVIFIARIPLLHLSGCHTLPLWDIAMPLGRGGESIPLFYGPDRTQISLHLCRTASCCEGVARCRRRRAGVMG